MISTLAVRAFSDNYIWLIRRQGEPRVAVVDPGDAGPVLKALEEQGLRLGTILITHHHHDHVGGVQRLLEHSPVDVYGPATESIPGRTHALREGDEITLDYLDLTLRVIEVPGHTSGHIAYHGEGMLFCGDTLFAGGCGRLFEGTPAQMHDSLSRLAALPDETRVYCAHEYTEANLRFASRVEPDNPDLARRLDDVISLRRRDACTLPSSLAEERRTNPFLRAGVPEVQRAAEAREGRELASSTDVFAAVRRWKDVG